MDVHTSDRLLITLVAHPTADVSARLVKPDAEKLSVFENVIYGERIHIGCRVVGRGKNRVEVEYLRNDGSVSSTWSLVLRATESPGHTSEQEPEM